MKNLHICEANCPNYVLSWGEAQARGTQFACFCTGGDWDHRNWQNLDPVFFRAGICPLGKFNPPAATAPAAPAPPKSDCGCGKAAGVLSIVIPTVDEAEADLVTTLTTIYEGTAEPIELILIDDHSKVPVPDAMLRNPVRLGCARSRDVGLRLAKGEFVAFLDAHMKIGPGNLRKLCAVAKQTHGMAYAGCNGNMACVMEYAKGLLCTPWMKTENKAQMLPSERPLLTVRDGLHGTSSMMGACYVMERQRLLDAGGWVPLPGFQGFSEFAMSLLLGRKGIPITCDFAMRKTQWHKFRDKPSAPVKHSTYLLNFAVCYRLMFGDKAWAYWKGPLAKYGISPAILKEAETPAWRAMGEKLRVGFVESDEAFVAKWGIKM